MIVRRSQLSLTIMLFAIKRSMIVDDSLSKSQILFYKMAVYRPRRAAISCILISIIEDDVCEELLDRHWKRSGYGVEMRRECIDLSRSCERKTRKDTKR